VLPPLNNIIFHPVQASTDWKNFLPRIHVARVLWRDISTILRVFLSQVSLSRRDQDWRDLLFYPLKTDYFFASKRNIFRSVGKDHKFSPIRKSYYPAIYNSCNHSAYSPPFLHYTGVYLSSLSYICLILIVCCIRYFEHLYVLVLFFQINCYSNTLRLNRNAVYLLKIGPATPGCRFCCSEKENSLYFERTTAEEPWAKLSINNCLSSFQLAIKYDLYPRNHISYG